MNAEHSVTTRHPTPRGPRFGVAPALAAVGRMQPGQLGKLRPRLSSRINGNSRPGLFGLRWSMTPGRMITG